MLTFLHLIVSEEVKVMTDFNARVGNAELSGINQTEYDQRDGRKKLQSTIL